MKTLVHLNEGTQIVLSMSFNELEEKIDNAQGLGIDEKRENIKEIAGIKKENNFLKVDCEKASYHGKECEAMKGKKFKLYLKRILFFYEI